ncbi:MAG TPA: AraC family transcriptional regulator [Terracidiphilus sp.]|nr:AraC family transcriptional regulator [Terracidiphilus sp.]
MFYLEHKPAAPLNRFVRTLWYSQAPQIAHGHERILPNGCVHLILNLKRDYLHDCPEGRRDKRVAPALVVGSRAVYEIVSRTDMADLMGVLFEPGGFAAFAHDAVDRFSNLSTDLEDLCGMEARTLRDRLREAPNAPVRFRLLEAFLCERMTRRLEEPASARENAVRYALRRFEHAPSMTTVRDVARSTGWSERRFSQVFREAVGHSPKVWCRIQRFQRAVQRLHTGVDVRWAELALDCGFYDQSHFANEFRAFSGVDATTYSALKTQWANHIRVE